MDLIFVVESLPGKFFIIEEYFYSYCSFRRALNTTPGATGSRATILIHQRFSWRRSSYYCDDTTISTTGTIGTGTLTCSGSCPGYTNIASDVVCTDFSIGTDCSSGERYDERNLTVGSSYILGYSGGAWIQLAIGGNGNWQLTVKIGLQVRPDGILNTSPVTSTLP